MSGRREFEGVPGQPRIELPLLTRRPLRDTLIRGFIRFYQGDPVRCGGGGSPGSDPRRGVGHGGDQRPDRQIEQLRRCELIKERKSKPCALKPGEPGGSGEERFGAFTGVNPAEKTLGLGSTLKLSKEEQNRASSSRSYQPVGEDRPGERYLKY